jgi:nucleoside-diphosphate-sugar epimerase
LGKFTNQRRRFINTKIKLWQRAVIVSLLAIFIQASITTEQAIPEQIIMIILFGATGYIGSEFKKQLAELKVPVFLWSNTRVTTFQDLENWYAEKGYPLIEYVINAAGYTGKPNVDACELHKADTIHGNVIWPTILTDWCILNDIPLGHVSSGCIYEGRRTDDQPFTEDDEPNFNFKYNKLLTLIVTQCKIILF